MLLLTFACAPATIATGDDDDEEDTDTGEGDDLSPFTGSWSGSVLGYANIGTVDDWTTEAYCEGEIDAEVLTTGEISGTGDCIIVRDQYAGKYFTSTLAGTVSAEGAFSATLSLADGEPDDNEDRYWEEATLAGTGDATAHILVGEADTIYHSAGAGDPEARVAVGLE